MGENTMRRAGLQPSRCTATSKQSGARCKAWAVVGAQVCHTHGGGREEVRRRGDLTAVAAQLGVIGLPPRDTLRVVQRALSDRMLDAAGALRAAAEEGRPVDPEEHQRFIDASDRALVAARVALQAGVEESSDSRDDEAGELVARAVEWSLDGVLAILDLSHEQRAQVRQYGLELATWALQGGHPDKRPEPPKLLPVRVAVAELLPTPARRRSADTADEVWRRAQEAVDVVDAELVDDQDEGEVGGGDSTEDPGEAA
jgi:hypothetical protein